MSRVTCRCSTPGRYVTHNMTCRCWEEDQAQLQSQAAQCAAMREALRELQHEAVGVLDIAVTRRADRALSTPASAYEKRAEGLVEAIRRIVGNDGYAGINEGREALAAWAGSAESRQVPTETHSSECVECGKATLAHQIRCDFCAQSSKEHALKCPMHGKEGCACG